MKIFLSTPISFRFYPKGISKKNCLIGSRIQFPTSIIDHRQHIKLERMARRIKVKNGKNRVKMNIIRINWIEIEIVTEKDVGIIPDRGDRSKI